MFQDGQHHSFILSKGLFQSVSWEVKTYNGSIAKRPVKDKGRMEKREKRLEELKRSIFIPALG